MFHDELEQSLVLDLNIIFKNKFEGFGFVPVSDHFEKMVEQHHAEDIVLKDHAENPVKEGGFVNGHVLMAGLFDFSQGHFTHDFAPEAVRFRTVRASEAE